MKLSSLQASYESLRTAALLPMEHLLESDLKVVLADVPRIDRISVRAKSVKRFIEKAARCDLEGNCKYHEPLREIQDLLGARIVTYYLSDLSLIEKVISAYYTKIERTLISPENSREFGYEGLHFILFIPDEINARFKSVPDIPKFFELQIKTLFQHAWAEAEHDLGYKAQRLLDTYERRMLAFAAAQAWGADRIFEEMYQAGNDGHEI